MPQCVKNVASLFGEQEFTLLSIILESKESTVAATVLPTQKLRCYLGIAPLFTASRDMVP